MCFSHLLAWLMVLVYYRFSVISAPLSCVFRIFWRASWYWCTIVFLWFVYPYAVFGAYSVVPSGIGVLLFSCDLCTPLVCFSYNLACPMVVVYYCFSVICAPLSCFFRILWRASWYWCTIVFLWFVHPSAVFCAYSGLHAVLGVLLFSGDLCTPSGVFFASSGVAHGIGVLSFFCD